VFNEKAVQKILFVCLVIIFVTSLRLLVQIKAGALLFAVLLVCLLIWVSFRLVNCIGRRLWVWAGLLAHFFAGDSGKTTNIAEVKE
jgi:hypothetical protein